MVNRYIVRLSFREYRPAISASPYCIKNGGLETAAFSYCFNLFIVGMTENVIKFFEPGPEIFINKVLLSRAS